MRRRYRKRRISDLVLTLLLLFVLGMGVGYSFFSTTLTIDGTSEIAITSWSIYFSNAQVTSGSVSMSTPSIINNRTISFSVTLVEPGDYYEFTADIVNAGNLNAKLDYITISPELTGALANYFNYTVTYSDGNPIQQNDALNAGETETIKVRVEYKTSSYHSLYPSSNVNLSFGIQINYIYGDGNQVRDKVYYYFDNTPFVIGSPIPSTVGSGVLYDDPSSAMYSFGHNLSLKEVISKTTQNVSETYVVFSVGTNTYLLDGADATNNGGVYAEDSANFMNRVDMMTAIFGSSNCNVSTSGTHYEYMCTVSSPNSLLVVTTSQGLTAATDGAFICGLYPDGTSYCDVYQQP